MSLTFKDYFDSMPCYVTIQDRDLRVVEANRRFRKEFGDFKGRYCYQIYKNREEKCEVCPVERTFRDGHLHTSFEQVRNLEGQDIAVIVYTTALRDENGEIKAVMEMSTDITDLRHLEEQLRQGQQRYQLMFNEVPCYISIQDPDLRIVHANRQFTEDFGSFLGCKCYEIYKHRDEECIPCPVQETFRDGQVHRSEEVVTAKDGEPRNVLVYSAPLFGPDGKIKHVMEMSTNITPIRELQSQLEGIGLLISSVSHGIKGLLTGLDGGRYLINSGLKKNNNQRIEQGWEMVQRNIDRIRDMVLNILYYAKEREPNLEDVSAPDLAKEICDIVEARATEQNVTLVRDLDESAGKFQADPRALRALLINLIENSIDACRVDKKKDEHQVKVSLRSQPEHVEFEVSDNGIGMDQETREKAFSLFFSSKGAEGTGLGLFIAHKITKAHGGNIRLESELDKGTRFIVTLSRQPSIKPEEEAKN
jgi:PAS domain S-box-containing protein